MQRDLNAVLGKLGLAGPGHAGEAAASDPPHADAPGGAEHTGVSLLFREVPEPEGRQPARSWHHGRGNGAAAPGPNGAHHPAAPAEIEQAIARIDGRQRAYLEELSEAFGRFYEPQLAAQAEQLADLRRRLEQAERERDVLAGRIHDLQHIATRYAAELRALSELNEEYSRRAGAAARQGDAHSPRVVRVGHVAGALSPPHPEPAGPTARPDAPTAPGARGGARRLVAAAKERARRLPGKQRALVREALQTLLLALVLFVSLHTLGLNVRVEGASMQPGFHDGQHLLVNKLVYFHFDRHVLGHLLGRRQGDPEAVYLFHPPRRGDVIILTPPGGSDSPYVKRVIALPGETVAVRDGTVYVDGRALDEPYIADPARYTYPVGASGDIAFTVPAGSVFVLGDNRNHSTDSHVFGPVPLDDVIGQAAVSYWPPGDIGPIAHQRYANADAGE